MLRDHDDLWVLTKTQTAVINGGTNPSPLPVGPDEEDEEDPLSMMALRFNGW